jgi:hypothetical protein
VRCVHVVLRSDSDVEGVERLKKRALFGRRPGS